MSYAANLLKDLIARGVVRPDYDPEKDFWPNIDLCECSANPESEYPRLADTHKYSHTYRTSDGTVKVCTKHEMTYDDFTSKYTCMYCGKPS